MRKKTVSHIADTIFWYVLYFLPIVSYLICILSHKQIDGFYLNFEQYLFSSNPLFSSTMSSPIFVALDSVFGDSGVLPLFNGMSNSILLVLTWFCNVYIVHLCIDFVLFIPRYCHKLMRDYTEGL